MKIENGEILYQNEHFERMQKTAKHFCFKFEKPTIPIQKANCMLRVLLNKDGKFDFEYKNMVSKNQSKKIAISLIVQDSKNEFLYYKTTYRPYFYDSFQKIKNGEIFDEIFFNEKGELTEGSRSNIVLQIGNKLYTPPINCGLLNGIYRQKLLNEGKCFEQILYKKDLLQAEKIYCINSVRGMVEVEL